MSHEFAPKFAAVTRAQVSVQRADAKLGHPGSCSPTGESTGEMYFCVFAESTSSPACTKHRAKQRFRGRCTPRDVRMHESCGSSELFTVDNQKTSGRIAAIRIPPRLVCFTSPRICWGRLEFCLGEKMNKADLVDRIAGACDMSKTQATTAIDTAVDSITAALKKGDRVALIGFGTFSVSQRKARNGRNPQTGATIKIAARRVAKFTPGAELKKAVNKK